MGNVLIIGTGNRHKAAELAQLLIGLPWDVKSLADFPAVPEPEEDGDTFEANALKKAHYYSEAFGAPCVADDSGLMVDALDGAPGVYSARYAGEGCSYADNNQKLLAALEDVPENTRTARFVCCAAFVDPARGMQHIETGTVQGIIGFAGRGANGFGYDPLFIPEGSARTFAEMDAEEKQSISHRGRAFAKIRGYLESLR